MKRWWPRPRREVTVFSSVLSSACYTTVYLLLSAKFLLCPFHLLCPSSLSMLLYVELKDAQKRKKQLEDRCKLEESIGTAAQTWNQEILPNWSTMWVQTPRIISSPETGRKGECIKTSNNTTNHVMDFVLVATKTKEDERATVNKLEKLKYDEISASMQHLNTSLHNTGQNPWLKHWGYL